MKTILIAAALLVISNDAFAQNCKSLPPGPERRQCAERYHPEVFQAKRQRCQDQAASKGLTENVHGGMREYIGQCMQGKVN